MLLKNIISTLFAKGAVAVINLAILLISCKQLGSDIRGQVSLIIFNIAIIQIINEIYTGYSLVYFIPKFSLKRIYFIGIIWTIACALIGSLILLLLYVFFDLGTGGHWIHLAALSILIIIHSFHMVIILSKEKIRVYNFLNFLQPALLLVTLLILFFGFNFKTVETYIIALYVSFGVSVILSTMQIVGVFKTQNPVLPLFETKHIIEKGFYNQLTE